MIEKLMQNADNLLKLVRSRKLGGNLVFSGKYDDLIKSLTSVTAKYDLEK